MAKSELDNIRHISFDFWNTLAVPNLEFSAHRTRLLAEFLQLEESDAKKLYTSVKKFMDTAAELTGFATSRENVMKMLNAQLPKEKQAGAGDLEILAGAIDDLFVAFPPTVPEELPGLIQQLVNHGITLNILSNTNFVRGDTLNEVVVSPAFGQNFMFQMYSDNWEIAKPQSDFFHAMIRNARKEYSINRQSIIHIGDNEITDVLGAEEVGIQALHVTDPYDTVRLLQGLLNE